MKKPTTISKESVSEYREFVQLRLRKRVLEAIEVVLEEEVDQALGCGSYERAEDRRGYRNGAETRRVTTSVGTRELRVPRAREPPRVFRRLQLLRGWSHDKTKQVFTGDERARSADGFRSAGSARISVVSDLIDCVED